MDTKELRKKNLRVPVLPSEEHTIKENAKTAGLAVAVYLRKCAIGYPIRSVLDQGAVKELAKVNADLGRLGGLLKMWLADDIKLSLYDPEQLRQTILGLLESFKDIRKDLLEKVKKL